MVTRAMTRVMTRAMTRVMTRTRARTQTIDLTKTKPSNLKISSKKVHYPGFNTISRTLTL